MPNLTQAPGQVQARQGARGLVPLTPVQQWFFETHPARPEHFTQSVMVELTPRPDEQALGRAFDAVLAHHDALRMRFTRVAGQWRQYSPPWAEPGQVLTRRDLSATNVRKHAAVTRGVAADLQAGFDLEAGPLVKAVLFDRGTWPPLLFMAAHHLVIDPVSWWVLLGDLGHAYRQARGDNPVNLGPKTTSFRDWARQFTALVAAGGLDGEREYWSAVGRGQQAAMPADTSPAGISPAGLVRSTRTVCARLSQAETRALLRQVPGSYRAQVNDVLMAALGRVLSRWTGQRRVYVDLEGHGRGDLLEGADLSRTVGWFTTIYPVALELPAEPAWGAALTSVQEQLRAVPHRGLGYGALRYLCGAAEAPRPWVSFSYLRPFDWHPGDEPFHAIHEDLAADADPDSPRSHPLEVVCAICRGRLEFTWYYSTDIHYRRTVRQLADEMTAAVREIITADAGAELPAIDAGAAMGPERTSAPLSPASPAFGGV
jgi:non-ribosomal peptide synthase protein (TIGR01720 family)